MPDDSEAPPREGRVTRVQHGLIDGLSGDRTHKKGEIVDQSAELELIDRQQQHPELSPYEGKQPTSLESQQLHAIQEQLKAVTTQVQHLQQRLLHS